jgi:type II secretory ATPase GspE/PulE/Tfp pilus assembly ATPase PilB-like protein
MVKVNQTQVNAKIGMTFAAALRSPLRQDPDILMVGEIRDGETMQIAIESAMTGHLVLSTLHTNSAAATLPRLLDMGAEAFLVASTVNVIIGQRLVRKLCNECKAAYTLSEKEIKTLNASFNMDELLDVLKKTPELKGVVTEKSTWKDIKFYHSKGCEQCNNEGYHGRLGIYEVLEMDESIGKLITSNASSDDLERKARENGMRTMGEDGFIKVAQGITSVEEVMRVTKE